MKIIDAKIGAEGSVSLEMVAGVLSFKAIEDTPGVKISLSADVPVTYLIDAGAQKANSPLLSAIASILDGVLKTIA